MSDTLSINIKIDNRIYPLVVNRKDEARYRSAAKRLNEVVASFKVNYPDKDMQDVMAMSAFQFVYSNLVLKEAAEQATLISEIRDINDDIDDFLASRVV
ncbi:MAG: cell division protein ZapA [Bacteroidota bacterium]|jgi:cell division protein ZapA